MPFQRIVSSVVRGKHQEANQVILPSSVNLANDAPTSLHVLMCHYNNAGTLERKLLSVNNTRYLAISHVWGDASWVRVSGITWDVLVSTEKARFMREQLPSIVGGEYFWMDILCVDQRDKASRISVTQHIPTIFRFAQKTIVVRSGTVIRDCCTRAMGDLDTWLKPKSPCRERLFMHCKTAHDGTEIEEVVLSRLWVLQEIILSDSIQFVLCDDTGMKRKCDRQSVEIEELTVKLMSTWASWAQYGSSEGPRGANHLDFVRSFLNCGTISRLSRARDYRPHMPNRWEFTMQLWSTHRSTKPRDFILAVMPQYSFYVLPQQARKMTFAQLFVDCFQQLEAKGAGSSWLTPLIMAQVNTANGDYLETDNIPEPTCLGDLVKLCLGPRIKIKRRLLGNVAIHRARGYRVQIKIPADLEKMEIIQCIRSCVSASKMLWNAARLVELTARDREPEVILSEIPYGTFGSASRPQVVAALKLLAEKHSGNREDKLLAHSHTFQSVETDVLLYTSTLISCGVGLSTFEWAKQNLTPVFVYFHAKEFQGFIPSSVLSNKDYDLESYQFFLFEVEKFFGNRLMDNKRFGLFAWNQGDKPASYIPCLFPPDVNLFGWQVWRNWISF